MQQTTPDMRKLYENDSTLAAENEIRSLVEKRFGVKMHKLPLSYHFDYFVTRSDQGIGWTEVKDRPNFRYDTYMLSVMKVVFAHQLASATGLPASLIVRVSGELMTYKFFAPEWVIAMGGRTDRDDPADIEPCVFIPIDKFRKINL